MSVRVGFIGLGIMGQPMALNLLRFGTPLVVWNRSAGGREVLGAAGAEVADSPAGVFVRADAVILMLVSEEATDAVLGRGSPDFAAMVAGRTVICMGSNAPGYSRALGAAINHAGGRYVEAPVSGSRKPAEAGQLVGLLGGEVADVARVRPLLAPICRATVLCGGLGDALLMKLSVNLYLNQMLAALAEAVHFANRHELDLARFREAIDAGPMACDVTRIKLPKLVERDFAPQALMTDASNSERLITEAAREIGIVTPMLDAGSNLYRSAVERGDGVLDMIGVLRVLEARSAGKRAA